MVDTVLRRLVTMSNELGDPALDYVILGEGNTSARIDDSMFWVKASGEELRTADANGFVQVRFDRALALLEGDDSHDDDVKAGLEAAKADPTVSARPSVETFLHALILQLEGVEFVGHTHPTAVNALTCSNVFEEAFSGSLFPDEIVVCGPAAVVVPYTDPGISLARKVRDLIDQFIREHGEIPRTIYMQNHGLIALGRTPQQVLDVTAMAVKRARVLIGTYVLGGPHFLMSHDVERIHTRPDELYRRKVLGD
jgi:rhamnose utilization protein RhaD (predicted bifunctional aldolase and dehydrogenase)